MKKLNAAGSWKSLLSRISGERFPFTVYGPQGSFLAVIIQALAAKYAKSLLVIVPTEKEAETLTADLQLFNVNACLFPWW